MKSLDEIYSIREKDGYIDVLKRTREYFKARGVFRITKGRSAIGITRDNP